MARDSVAAERRWFFRHRWKMVHGVRITAASIIAFALVYALGFSEGLWAVITAIVVTQSSIGSSLKAVFEQFVGSLFGAGYAATVALTIRPETELSSAIALVVALVPLSILAAFSAGFRIAPVTAAIILLGSADLEIGPLGLAVSRIVGVGLGCGVGLLVSVFFIPVQASRSVLETAARIASLLAEQLEILATRGNKGQEHLASLAVRTRETLDHLETLVEEAARERRTWLANAPDGEPLLRTIRRLRHDVSMLRRAARELGRNAPHEHAADHWLCAAEAGAATLRRIGHVLSGQQPPTDSKTLAIAVRGYRIALDEMRRAGLTQSLSTAALGRLFGIGFALEQFRRDLDDLIERSREIYASRGRSRSVTRGLRRGSDAEDRV